MARHEESPTGEAIEAWKERRAVGEARVRAALDHVQQAQVELNLAMLDLCSVIGYVKPGDRLMKLHNAVRAEWYRIDKQLHRGPMRMAPQLGELDHQPNAEEQANAHAGGCGRHSWKESFFSESTIGRRGTSQLTPAEREDLAHDGQDDLGPSPETEAEQVGDPGYAFGGAR